MTKIELPGYVETVIERLADHGYESYAVGGCVRDHLMGKTPHDYDITTSAEPGQVAECFEGFRIIATGLKHGTLTVLSEDHPIEITTYRTDGEYEDNRHPKQVAFTKSLSDDLSRRDFTINAMAYNHKTGLVDLFGGREDLREGVIRCVGEADVRFNEDGLRIIRALRFASCLGFGLDSGTRESVFRNMRLLENISSERIYAEFSKLICGMGAADILYEYRDVFCVVIPELRPMIDHPQRTKYHCYDVYMHTIKAIEASPPDKIVRYALLFHDSGKPDACTVDPDGTMHFKGHDKISAEISERALRRLKTDRELQVEVKKLVEYHSLVLTDNEKSLRRLLGKLSFDEVRRLIEVEKADSIAHAPDYRTRAKTLDDVLAAVDRIEKENLCVKIKDLEINGKDVMSLGVGEGRLIGDVLERLLSMVVEGEIPNRRDVLLDRAREIIEKSNSEEKDSV